ncbi:MAG: hypothetical protein NWF05_05610 [Candidatus Bathyarchaeota archaeon]|nr:hypothetical protein [Candidatus Bathyarchaeota archaeon]
MSMQTVAPIYGIWDGSFVGLDANDYPHITYAYSSAKVYLASWNGTGWSTQLVTDKAFFLGDTMPLALDSQGRPHLCYLNVRTTGYSYLDGSVVYAFSNESVTTPMPTPTPTPSPSPSPSPSIPEFPPFLMGAFVIVSTFAGVIFCKKKHRLGQIIR